MKAHANVAGHGPLFSSYVRSTIQQQRRKSGSLLTSPISSLHLLASTDVLAKLISSLSPTRLLLMTLKARNRTISVLLTHSEQIFSFTSKSNVLHSSQATRSVRGRRGGILTLDMILHRQKDMSSTDSGRISSLLVTSYSLANIRVAKVGECLSTLFRECVPTL